MLRIDAKMLRYPDISSSGIVFVYADDIWIVGRDGGIARRLTSPKGQESFPKFSPDGKYIAFSGNYDGNIDIYTMMACKLLPSPEIRTASFNSGCCMMI